MTDNESGLKTSFSFLHLVGPLLSPEVLEREEGVTDLVIHLDVSLKVGLLLVDQVLWELLHWAGDSVEQMSRPSNGTGDSWQVSDHRRVALHLDILVLNVFDLETVVLEKNGILGVETRFQVLSVEDSLELS